jgi:hypothetical protein
MLRGVDLAPRSPGKIKDDGTPLRCVRSCPIGGDITVCAVVRCRRRQHDVYSWCNVMMTPAVSSLAFSGRTPELNVKEGLQRAAEGCAVSP